MTMTMTRLTTCFGGVHQVIGTNNRRGWWHRDFQGCYMLRYCNIGKGHCGVMLRKNLYVKATIGIGISGDYHDDEGLNGVVDGMMNGRGDSKRIVAEQHEHWLHNSVTEIVKNVGEAPLLVHIYTENGPKKTSKLSSSSTTNVKFVIEKTTSFVSWTKIKHRWENSCYSTIPNGIILVEELGFKTTKQEYQDKFWCLDSSSTSNSDNIYKDNFNEGSIMVSSSSATRLWGVLVQGKRVNFHSCYLLKTCQVKCCFGSTTHFCLAKVDNNCFGTSYDLYLN